MSHRRTDSSRHDRAQLSKGPRPGRREPTKRRVDVEGLEARQLMATQVITYPIPLPAAVPAKIALVSDGSLWFTENGTRPAATLGRITTSGQLTEPAVLSAGDTTFGLTVGPDNNLWTTEQGPTAAIAQVFPSATSPSSTQFTNFAPIAGNPNPVHFLNGISRGAPGDNSFLWFTDSGTNAIGRIAVNGAPNQLIQEFTLPANRMVGPEITGGPAGDNGVYFLETATFGTQSFIGRIDPNGVITEFPVTNPDGLTPGNPTQLTAGPGDAIYFTESNAGRVGKLDLATGAVNDDFFSIPDVAFQPGQVPFPAGPTAIALFPDGSFYITESNIGSVARLTVDSTGAVTGFFQYSTFPGVTGSLPGIASDLTGNPWFTISGRNAIGTFAVPNSPLQAQPVTINGVVNQPLTNIPIATFTDPNGPSPSTQYRATIDWGDGTPLDSKTTFTPAGPASSFIVRGTHIYTTVGRFNPTVTISDLASPRTATVFDTAIIAGPSTGPGGPPALATAGTPLIGRQVASFPVNPATASGYSATVDWGDGTALGGATVTGPTTINGVATDAVIASHTFEKDGTYSGSVIVHNPDGSQTVFPLTSTVSGLINLGGGLTGLSGTAGTPILPTTTPLAQVTSNAFAQAPDAAFYTATVNYGDGSPTESANIVNNGFGFLNILESPHTYAAPGAYTITYTVGDAGVPALFTGTVPVTIGGVVGTPTPLPSNAVVGQPITGFLFQPGNPSSLPVPLLTVSGLPAPKSGYYSATIDYGDGSPTSVGTLSTNQDGTFTVNGPAHIYEFPGSFQINILIGTTGQPNLASFSNRINVTEAPISINGILNPASDSGISNTDGITNITTPNFLGNTGPGATVTIFATLPGSAVAPIQIGRGVADASGAYSITTIPLADGTYDISVIAIGKFGEASAVAVIEGGSHPLVIDTAGPKILAFSVSNTLKGQFQVEYQDERSGLVTPQLVNGANYDVQRTTPAPLPFQNFIVSSLTATAEAFPTQPVIVTGSVFNGHYLVLRGGAFVFTISSSGITDVAGNHLDGTFYGTFPTGNGGKGGDFKAEVIIKGYTPSGPIPFTTASPGHPGVPTIAPSKLAPKLKKPGLNAPPTSLPGQSTGQSILSTAKPKHVVVAAKHKA